MVVLTLKAGTAHRSVTKVDRFVCLRRMSAVEKSVGVQTTPKNTTPTGAQDASCFLEPYSASDLTSDGAEGSQVTSAEDSVNTTERVDEPFQGMGPEVGAHNVKSACSEPI